MRRLLARLLGQTRGTSTIEFALSAPLFLALIIGTAQLGIIFQANSGIKHALGEAARYATLFPTPTDDQIKSKARGREFGLDSANIVSLTATRGTVSGTAYVDLQMSYRVPLDFIFLRVPGVTLTESRRAFLP